MARHDALFTTHLALDMARLFYRGVRGVGLRVTLRVMSEGSVHGYVRKLILAKVGTGGKVVSMRSSWTLRALRSVANYRVNVHEHF